MSMASPIAAKNLIVSGRPSYQYTEMFGVLLSELDGLRVLDIGGGASSFAFDAAHAGAHVTAVDPLYDMPAQDIQDLVVRGIDYAWALYKGRASPEYMDYHRRLWLESGHKFAADYTRHREGAPHPGPGASEYIVGSLPDLPLARREYDAVFVSHVLLCYDLVPLEAALKVLLDVLAPTGKIYIHPVYSPTGEEYEWKEAVDSIDGITYEIAELGAPSVGTPPGTLILAKAPQEPTPGEA